jgi:hypothetical protein
MGLSGAPNLKVQLRDYVSGDLSYDCSLQFKIVVAAVLCGLIQKMFLS